MKAVLYHCSPNTKIQEVLIDAFEYFISILENGTKIKLILIEGTDLNRNAYIKIFENKYDLNDLDYKDHIITVPLKKLLIKYKFDKVLVVDWRTIWHTRGYINSKEIVVLSEGNTDCWECTYSKDLYNVVYYGELPIKDYFVPSRTYLKDVDYRQKFLFNRYKDLKKMNNDTYVHSPENEDYSFLDNLKTTGEVCIKPISTHLIFPFEQFSLYVYYHNKDYIDFRPRLFHEFYFYNKEIKYINESGIKDGSYYRYKDLMETGLDNRTLSDEDEIVRLFI